MRVVAGHLGGRIFRGPAGHRTHPMGDKVRGALFNILGDINGLSVLDAFAGSGAISFEAISRGADCSTLIEIDKNAYKVIAENIESLGISKNTKLIRANVSGWSDRNIETVFDLVICDPPYNALRLDVLRKLTRHVKPFGIYVLSWPSGEKPPELPKFNLLSQKEYAGAQLLFYKSVTY